MPKNIDLRGMDSSFLYLRIHEKLKQIGPDEVLEVVVSDEGEVAEVKSYLCRLKRAFGGVRRDADACVVLLIPHSD